MAELDGVSLLELFYAAPVKTVLFIAAPVVLAVAQLVNGLSTSLPIWVAVAFGLLMLATSAVLLRHHRAEYRLTRLERDLAFGETD